MSETAIDLPSLEHGFVKGRFVLAQADSLEDEDRYPDLRGESGAVRFVPQHVIYLTEGPEPATVEPRLTLAEIDERGHMVDITSETDQSREPGLWLAVGRYTVELQFAGSRKRRSFPIEVKPEHTKENPLHLTLAEPQEPIPGTTEVVRIEDRVRAEEAAVTAETYRNEAEVFRDQAQLATQGASAYQVAVQQGFEDTEAEWLESLVGSDAYRIAVKNGFQGTEDEWLESLRGPQGDPGEVPGLATSESDGLMSAADKITVDSFAVPITRYWAQVSDGDWSDAFNAALEDAGAVSVPAGEFMVTDLEVPAGKTVSGEPGAALKLADGEGGGIVVQEGAMLLNLLVDGNGAKRTSSSETLIQVTGESARLANVIVKNAYHRAFVVEIGADFTRLDSCVVRDSGYINNCNAFTIKASHVLAHNCQVIRHGNGHGFRTGRFPSVDPDVNTTHVSLVGCAVYDSEHNAFTTEYGSRHITLQACMAENVPQAIKGEDAEDVTLVGCIFRNITLSTAWNMQDVYRGVYKGNQLIDSAGGMLLGENAVCEGNTLVRINRQVIEANRGAVIIGNLLEDCDNQFYDYHIRMGHGTTAEVSKGVVSNNVIKNPKGTANVTAIGILSQGVTCSGNVLIGHAARGIRVLGSASNYTVTGNLMHAADTPIMDGGLEPKFISGNV